MSHKRAGPLPADDGPPPPRHARQDSAQQLELDVMGALYSFACLWEQRVLAWPDLDAATLSARRQQIATESARSIIALMRPLSVAAHT